MDRDQRPDTDLDATEYRLSFNWPMRVLMTLLLAGPGRCRVRVGSSGLEVRMGAGGWSFVARVPLSSIVEVARYPGQVWAWGAHGWQGRWLVNGSSRGLVSMTIEPVGRGRCLGFAIKVRQLTVSLEDPDGFIAAVRPTPAPSAR
jgi:hypothetical protein